VKVQKREQNQRESLISIEIIFKLSLIVKVKAKSVKSGKIHKVRKTRGRSTRVEYQTKTEEKARRKIWPKRGRSQKRRRRPKEAAANRIL
jgi:hypothetical protein